MINTPESIIVDLLFALEEIQSISKPGYDLSMQETIDDGEECIDAYIVEMPQIYLLTVEALKIAKSK